MTNVVIASAESNADLPPRLTVALVKENVFSKWAVPLTGSLPNWAGIISFCGRSLAPPQSIR